MRNLSTSSPSVPSVTCREKSWRGWGLALTAAGNAAVWGLVAALSPAWPVAGFVGLGLASAATLWRAWRRRRLGLRGDDAGVHELFPGGRTVAHLWNDLRWIARAGDNKFVLCTHARTIVLTPRIDDVRPLAALIRARLQGKTLAPPPDLPTPSAEQVAEWLGVEIQALPVRFRYDVFWLWANLIVVLTVVLSATCRPISFYYIPCICCALNLFAIVSILLKWRRARIEVGAQGLMEINWRGQQRFHAWSDILDLSGDDGIRGRYEDWKIPTDLRRRERLIALIRRVLEARGEVPEEARQPGPPISRAAISRARPPGSPTPGDAALSRAERPEEEPEKERLGAAAEETEVVVSIEAE
jgi:hypothetical protein